MERQDREEQAAASTRRLWLAGLALGMFLTLLALPPTGWMVREQLAMQARAPVWFGQNDEIAQGAVRAADRSPGDYQLQLAKAMMDPKDPGSLRALRGRFPDNPSLIAATLRIATRSIRLAREE